MFDYSDVGGNAKFEMIDITCDYTLFKLKNHLK